MESVWTNERVDQLKRLRADGLSCTQIGDDLGLGRNAVVGKIHRLKLPPPASRAPSDKPRKRRRPPRTRPLDTGRRNPSHNILAKIASAEADPGLPERLKGEVPDGTGIKLRELTELTCHWPIGDPKTPEFEYCGARAVKSFPYCLGHCRLAYQLTQSSDADEALCPT